MKSVRNIIEINEDLCNGCGQCILDCAEGAITLADGKAKVISDILCDGLGACLGGCPTGALRIVQRVADAYDEEAVERHLATHDKGHGHHGHGVGGHGHHAHGHRHSGKHASGAHGDCCQGGSEKRKEACGCPGSKAESFTPVVALTGCGCPGSKAASFPARAGDIQGKHGGGAVLGNTHWPLKLRLMSPDAPFLRGADLLLAADCAAFASPAFHEKLLPGKVVLIACPKFEGAEALAERLAEIFRVARPKSCTVARMEVPCCKGLMEACRAALAMADADVPISEVIITRQGEVAEGGAVGKQASGF